MRFGKPQIQRGFLSLTPYLLPCFQPIDNGRLELRPLPALLGRRPCRPVQPLCFSIDPLPHADNHRRMDVHVSNGLERIHRVAYPGLVTTALDCLCYCELEAVSARLFLRRRRRQVRPPQVLAFEPGVRTVFDLLPRLGTDIAIGCDIAQQPVFLARQPHLVDLHQQVGFESLFTGHDLTRHIDCLGSPGFLLQNIRLELPLGTFPIH